MKTRFHTVRRSLRAGFTLIEMLAVILIITILAVALLPQITEAREKAQVTACKLNLKKIGEGFLGYDSMYHSWPTDGGAQFFTCFIYMKVWEDTETNAQYLSCPAINSSSLSPGIDKLPLAEWYTEKDRIDGGYTAYAGRDVREHKLRQKIASGKTVLVADDNDPDGNHRTATNALFGDYSVRTFEFMTEVTNGNLSEEEGFIRVGPDSQIEALQVLSLD